MASSLPVKRVPDKYHSVTPSLTFKNTQKAIEYYEKAFGAKRMVSLPSPVGEGTMHAVIMIGNSMIMMGDENPGCQSAESMGGTPISLYVYVPDVDAAFKQAIAAGGTVVMPVADMFWGDRAGWLKDPFGYQWTLATQTHMYTHEEIQKGALAFFESMKNQK